MAKQSKMSASISTSDLAAQKAAEYMPKYHGCAPCTLMAILEAAGMPDDNLVKAAGGLSGGIGGTGSVCGVLTGASLALGVKYGRDIKSCQADSEEARKQLMQSVDVVGKLAKWFEREFGSTLCNEIRRKYAGTDLSMEVPWQREWAEQLKMGECCEKMAAKTARRAMQMLENPNIGLIENKKQEIINNK
jgi:C_GCAxxG_C_C family probable redox protein